MLGFQGDSLGYHHLVKLLPVKLLNVESLHLLTRLSIEYRLWSFPGDLFEHSSVKFALQVAVNELADFRELVQTSS